MSPFVNHINTCTSALLSWPSWVAVAMQWHARSWRRSRRGCCRSRLPSDCSSSNDRPVQARRLPAYVGG